MDGTAERLVELGRDRAGDQLRTITKYDGGEYEAFFIRDDLRERYTEHGFGELIDAARRVHDAVHPLGDIDAPIGTHRATVHSFDEAVVIQLIEDGSTGYLVSFDRTVGTQLTDFVTALNRVAGIE